MLKKATMTRRFGQSLRIGVSPQAVSLLKVSRFGRAAPELLAVHHFDGEPGPGFEAIAAAMGKLLEEAGCAGWSATVVLSAELARIWQVTPPPGTARMADLQGAAALRFQTLYGESAASWQVTAGWDAVNPFMAAAVPRQLLALLEQEAARERVILVEIVPQFVAGWNQWRKVLGAGDWYGLVQGGVLSLGALDAGGVAAVRVAPVPAGAGIDWLAQHVTREALRLNLPAPSRLQVSGAAPVTWNNSAGAFACTVLQVGQGELPSAALLAATGGRA